MNSCTNPHVHSWVEEVASRLKPERIVWIDGSDDEADRINQELIAQGTFFALNQTTYPNCFLARSHPDDVARVEDRTFICTLSKEDAGPTNNWCNPNEMYQRLGELMDSCMAGRTMYVVPYLMGPDGSPFSRVGFELTDSAYVVANMRIMARVGKVALKNLGAAKTDFVRGIHSVGTLDKDNKYICHFPEDNAIISINSNYGGNALQGKKCFALRIASSLGRAQGWMAEHMLIVGITNPRGEKHYICAAFPSACGKTNLAMLIPPKSYLEAGWKVETVGDDIAWLNFGKDGRLYAINPEAGFFGVAPGTSKKTNANAMASIQSNTIFTNTALNLETSEPWWEGMSEAPKKAIDWQGNDWTPSSKVKASHPNARFTAPASQCPCIDPEWESPQGVPISAIVFGGRRPHAVPLVYQARSWQHGTFVGVTMASETTAAAMGKVGELRRDPMAMLPFIGYHAGDYFRHWLAMGAESLARGQADKLPKIFHVNWFRTGSKGEFLWPGFGDNLRVLEWILERVAGRAGAHETALGFMPRPKDLNVEGLGLAPQTLESLLEVIPSEWKEDLRSQEDFFKSIGPKMPPELVDEHNRLKIKLGL